MRTDVSKLCADFLRNSYASETGAKLKASHARELVAAFFGYKSHAALIAEKAYPLTNLEDAEILVPDIPLVVHRCSRLKELPSDLFSPLEMSSRIGTFLSENGYFNGTVWLYESIETYVTDILLINNDSLLIDELSGVIAVTNAEFGDFPDYESSEISDTSDTLVIDVSGKLRGTQLEDKLFYGDTIDLKVKVTLYRIAGKRGFSGFDVKTEGSVNDDWADPQVRYEVPNIRPKEQFLEMTGGFRFGETQEQLENRLAEIHTIRNRISDGEAKEKDIDRLSHLFGKEYD